MTMSKFFTILALEFWLIDDFTFHHSFLPFVDLSLLAFLSQKISQCHHDAIDCVKYLLTIPGIDVNRREGMPHLGDLHHTPFTMTIARTLITSTFGELTDDEVF